MVEQTGSIFFECSHGFYHTNSFASVIPRNHTTLLPETNIDISSHCQVLSVLPTSYPGHSIITEDIGEILPRNKIKCNLDTTHYVRSNILRTSLIYSISPRLLQKVK